MKQEGGGGSEDFGDCGGSTGYQSREKKVISTSSGKKQLDAVQDDSVNKLELKTSVIELIKEELLRRKTE